MKYKEFLLELDRQEKTFEFLLEESNRKINALTQRVIKLTKDIKQGEIDGTTSKTD